MRFVRVTDRLTVNLDHVVFVEYNKGFGGTIQLAHESVFLSDDETEALLRRIGEARSGGEPAWTYEEWKDGQRVS